MESNQPNAVVVGRAQIPPGDSLIADILAVDDMSYFYLSFKDSSVMVSVFLIFASGGMKVKTFLHSILIACFSSLEKLQRDAGKNEGKGSW